MYVIDTECFDEYILFHVRTAKHFFIRFFLWNKCFERRQYFKSVYLHNNITVLIPKEENKLSYIILVKFSFFLSGPGPWTRTPDPGPWTRTRILDPETGPWTLDPGPGPWKTCTLKNLDPEKPGINIGLQNMSDFRELCFTKTICKVSTYLKACVLTDI